MKIFVLSLISLFFLFPQPGAAELVYVPLPVENSETVIASHTPMIRYLAEKLGVPIKIRYEKDYQQILQLFKEGKIDLVQLGPLPYVTLKKEDPQTQPIVIMNESDGKPAYTCALVTSFDGPQSVQEINSPLALPQALSTCGHLAAALLLKDHQPDLEQLGYQYLGNHGNVALAVVRGEFKAGVMKTQVARKFQNLTLKVLQETGSFPGFVIVGNKKTLNSKQAEKIGQLLIQASPQVRSSWITGKDGFSLAADKDFDFLTRHMAAVDLQTE
ncbi:MAG: PhnD/SsuA/transferrin family substrate-binding protein [Desulfocapsaceae bacterium]|nr:PhnD/SsuA/transferrin family substrate-binding protein [Desulfocapsaceae bacterium]